MNEDKEEYTIDYYKERFNYWLTYSMEKDAEITKLKADISDLEDQLGFKNADIDEYEIVVSKLREKNAELFGELCGIKFAMRLQNKVFEPIPVEE